jgi:hypothetical protein
VLAALAATSAGVVATGWAAQATALPVAACATGRAGVGTISIGARQNGKTICLAVGEDLVVELASPAATGLGWAPVKASPPGILTKGRSTTEGSRFVTEASFTADHKGIAELSSQRPTCAAPSAGRVTCGALLYWGARVVVVTSHPRT